MEFKDKVAMFTKAKEGLEVKNNQEVKNAIKAFNQKVKVYEEILEEVKPCLKWLIDNHNKRNFFLNNGRLGKIAQKQWDEKIIPIIKKYKERLKNDRNEGVLLEPRINGDLIRFNFKLYETFKKFYYINFLESKKTDYGLERIIGKVCVYIENFSTKAMIKIDVPEIADYENVIKNKEKIKKLKKEIKEKIEKIESMYKECSCALEALNVHRIRIQDRDR